MEYLNRLNGISRISVVIFPEILQNVNRSASNLAAYEFNTKSWGCTGRFFKFFTFMPGVIDFPEK